jgi:hypothetical protein
MPFSSSFFTCCFFIMRQLFVSMIAFLLLFIIPLSSDAQIIEIPKWSLRGDLGFLVTGQTNQGPGGATLLGGIVEYNPSHQTNSLLTIHSGLMALHSDGALSLAIPLELNLGGRGKRFGMSVGLGMIYQKGEALLWSDEESLLFSTNVAFRFFRPNRAFFWNLGFRLLRGLETREYSNGQWSDAGKSSAFGLFLGFGSFLDTWKTED